MLLREVMEFAKKGYFRQNGLHGYRWEIRLRAVFKIEIDGKEIRVAGFKDGTHKGKENTFFYRDGEIERALPMRQSRLIEYSLNRPILKERAERKKTESIFCGNGSK